MNNLLESHNTVFADVFTFNIFCIFISIRLNSTVKIKFSLFSSICAVLVLFLRICYLSFPELNLRKCHCYAFGRRRVVSVNIPKVFTFKLHRIRPRFKKSMFTLRLPFIWENVVVMANVKNLSLMKLK